MSNLLIIESGGKKETLKKILGPGWDVQASGGHITQLAKDGPGNFGFVMKGGRVDCHYELNGERGESAVARIKAAVKRVDQVYLATDPDREGEAISWHIAQTLGLKNPQRITFTEITREAVHKALAEPKKIDMAMVDAQRCRQCLDRLIGFTLSPLLQRSIRAKSAGRVQSAALRIICERETEIQIFKPQPYWNVWVDYTDRGKSWRAYFKQAQEREPIASENEQDDTNEAKPSQNAESTRVLSQEEAERLVRLARSQSHQVMQVEGKTTPKSPPPPLITSSLQQVAGAKLGYKPERTMEIAEKLYQGVDLGDGPKGLITYMRTDSVSLASEFVETVHGWLEQNDPKNLAEKKGTAHRNKAGAQGAHEAIRPCYVNLTPEQVKAHLTNEQFALYSLIWRRAVASLSAPALLRKTRIVTQSGAAQWEAKGMAVEFAGYTLYWDDLSEELGLPTVRQGQALTLKNSDWEKKQTQPPSRYSEPKLVQQMERRGIGRPSTYAIAGKTLLERAYVELKGKVLIPTELGRKVDELLMEHFPKLVDSKFTAQMESTLDQVSEGKEPWEPWLIGWNTNYLDPALAEAAKSLPEALGESVHTRQLEKARVSCPGCNQPLSKIPTKKMKKGYFLKCENGCIGAEGNGLVMFWSDRLKQWQQPQKKLEPPSEERTTEIPCPVCKKRMEIHSYEKEGKQKQLLRCSDSETRGNPNHKDVVFFQSKGKWWSPKLGELKDSN